MLIFLIVSLLIDCSDTTNDAEFTSLSDDFLQLFKDVVASGVRNDIPRQRDVLCECGPVEEDVLAAALLCSNWVDRGFPVVEGTERAHDGFDVTEAAVIDRGELLDEIAAFASQDDRIVVVDIDQFVQARAG